METSIFDLGAQIRPITRTVIGRVIESNEVEDNSPSKAQNRPAMTTPLPRLREFELVRFRRGDGAQGSVWEFPMTDNHNAITNVQIMHFPPNAQINSCMFAVTWYTKLRQGALVYKLHPAPSQGGPGS